jgi:serine/threonine protein kinase/tetratricopeptide (TPR) repeat protein
MWERVKELFHEAVKRPAGERGEFLAAACGGDDDLRAEVEQLLASHDEIGDDSVSSKSRSPEDREGRVFPVEGPGSVIGRYKPLEEIGEGGMGVVYLAQQEQPVRRKVALKIIKLGMDTKEVIARFEAERQALAIMDHANIAKVFDAGTTELGRPYFVMEHIPGVPITDYCDENRLNAAERLRLFIPVCHAIHHAHQKGIIHRDVKPSNVLVTVQDGKPVPKVIDFGVAKAVNQRLTEKTIFTDHGVLIGTPVYMSPEQADLTGLSVDTTTDVYSLGTLLYELLAGAPPFDPKSLREIGFEAIHRMIREVEPPKPSNRFSGLGDEGTTVAERRRTEPATLERQIRGELDWITMRAMEKDRSRRYQSASEFAADIERYLHDEPVEAGPPSRTYRMRKFVRRNKAGVGLAAAAIVIMVAFAATMTVQADRIARERDRAQLEAKRSRVEAELSQAFYWEILRSYGTPEVIVSRVREAWDLHRESLAGDASALAVHAVNMLPVLDLMEFFGDGDKTELLELKNELEAEAFDLIDQAIAERDTSILKTVGLMILRLEDREGMSEHESETILQLYRGALTVCRDALSADDPRLIQNLTKLADYLEAKGRRALNQRRFSDAEQIFRELLEMRLEINPPESGWTWFPAIARGLLGESLSKLNRYAEAEPLLLESLEVNKTREARVRVIGLYESWCKPEKVDQYRKDLWVESIRELGTVGTHEVRNMDLGFSASFAGRSVWAFRNGMLTNERVEGRGVRANRWAWTDYLDARQGIRLQEPGHGFDGRRELLPLTPDEKSFNDDHFEDPEHTSDLGTAVPTEQWAVFPGPVIADPDRGRALVVYTKVHAIVYSGGRQTVGHSLAAWEHPDSAVVRPILRPETEYPTMLFQGDEPALGTGALVDGDFLYLYAHVPGGWDSHCIVARAPLAEALDRNAWRFFAGDDNWKTDWKSAIRVLDGAATLTVHWNDYLGKYLAVSTPSPFGNVIVIHTADRPEGPWSSGRLIYSGWLPNGEHARSHGAVAHPEFAREDGRIQYITFYRPTGNWFGGELRLLEVTLK